MHTQTRGNVNVTKFKMQFHLDRWHRNFTEDVFINHLHVKYQQLTVIKPQVQMHHMVFH